MKSSPHKNAFTLIELLVVIAIIAMLAALLLGGASSALDTSKLASCKNNLGQWGKGLHLYLSDGNDTLPTEGVGSTSEGNSGKPVVNEKTAWFNALAPFLDIKPPYQVAQDLEPLPRPRDRSVFTCPVVRPDAADNYKSGTAFMSYAQNLWIEHHNMSERGKDYSPILKFDEIPDPSHFAFLSEAKNGSFANCSANTLAYRHQRKKQTVNIVFVDSHVASFRRADIYTPDKFTNRGGIIWNPDKPY